jgi:hypothetical protein
MNSVVKIAAKAARSGRGERHGGHHGDQPGGTQRQAAQHRPRLASDLAAGFVAPSILANRGKRVERGLAA